MKIAFVMFDGMTSMDFIGFYEAITWLKLLGHQPELEWHFCALQPTITDDRGLVMQADHVGQDLSGFDLLFIPGGLPTRQLRCDPGFVSWLQSAGPAQHKVSVCTGALLLGAAGFLKDKKATTNAGALELLVPYCEQVLEARVVRDGNTITGGGVTCSIDVGLYVVEMLTSPDVADVVKGKLHFPFYQTGLPEVYLPSSGQRS